MGDGCRCRGFFVLVEFAHLGGEGDMLVAVLRLIILSQQACEDGGAVLTKSLELFAAGAAAASLSAGGMIAAGRSKRGPWDCHYPRRGQRRRCEMDNPLAKNRKTKNETMATDTGWRSDMRAGRGRKQMGNNHKQVHSLKIAPFQVLIPTRRECDGFPGPSCEWFPLFRLGRVP